jgi:hypothetical protein
MLVLVLGVARPEAHAAPWTPKAALRRLKSLFGAGATKHAPPIESDAWLEAGGFKPGRLGGGLVLEPDGTLHAPSGDYDGHTKEWAVSMLRHAHRNKLGPFADSPSGRWRPRELDYEEAKARHPGSWVVPLGLRAPARWTRLSRDQQERIATRTEALTSLKPKARLVALSAIVEALEQKLRRAHEGEASVIRQALEDYEIDRQIAHALVAMVKADAAGLPPASVARLEIAAAQLVALDAPYERERFRSGDPYPMY